MVGIKVLHLIVDLRVFEVMGWRELDGAILPAVALFIIADEQFMIFHRAGQAPRSDASEYKDEY